MALDERSKVRQLDLWCYIENQCLSRFNIRFVVKKDQGQPRFIICANLVGPTSPILHTKSQDHWPFGSRVEDI